MFRKRLRYICGSLVFILALAGGVGYALHLKQINAVAEQKVTRGVIDNLNQLPDTKKVEEPKYKVGTKENPFLVLEIVPYEEYAEFGYMISGCEPVNVEEMFGSGYLGNLGAGQLNSADVTDPTGECYFFEDEPEGQKKYYAKDDNVNIITNIDVEVEGYYEKVEAGRGFFEQTSDGSIVKKDKGDIIWHTVNQFEKNDYKNVSFEDDISILKNIGDRIYTKRSSNKDRGDYIHRVYNYKIYKNRDNFLRDSLLLSEKEAENYSIVIKTITPKELNDNPEWVSYSNLISISPKRHVGVLIDMWKKYNRLGKVSNLQNADYKDNFMGERDISWEVAKKIYFRATQSNDSSNYAGVVMDREVYCISDANFFPNEPKYKKDVEFDVYDFNFKSTGKYKETGSNNNVFKLSVMLLCMDSDVFKNLYFNKDNPFKRGYTLIDNNGKIILQDGDAADYWTFYTFFVINADEKKMSDGYWQVWTRKENDSDNETIAWKRWKYNVNLTGSDPWIYNHVYTYNGNNSLNMQYMNNGWDITHADKKFTGFYDSVEDYKDRKFGTDEEIKEGKESKDEKVREDAIAAEKAKREYQPTPSNAVRYILGVFDGGDTPKSEKTVINILDLEPSVNLVKAESKTNNENVKVKPEYYLTENYVRMLLSDFDSEIKITHMTTAEFIGKTEDINSKYDMIFMGLDDSAYNKDSDGKTAWNDWSMSGKIYFHTGDKMTSTEQIMKDNGVQNRSVDFLWSDKSSGNPWEKHITLRFPGNDITKIKKAELEDFAKSGHPIVAVPYLYNTEEAFIDKNSNIYAFIKSNKGKGVYNAIESQKIMDALKANNASVEFTKTPIEYKGETDDSNNIKDGSYLPKNSSDQSVLEFAFKLKDLSNSKYRYNIYIDQNQDGKYSDDEVYYTSDEFSADEAQSYRCRLSKLFLGVVQWKIEVYNAANSSIRFVKTGCSAAKRSDGIEKKQINVLQIMPSSSNKNYQGKLDLEKNRLFTQYYNKIQAYEINVKSITVDEFEGWFKNNNEGKKFSFDISDSLSDANPKNYTTTLKNKLKNYNMLIFGFGDTYNDKNISNDHGAVDYIKYFITLGKSVLFTHDLSSMYNVNKNDFGYVVNAQLRDVMGMNRYKVVSNQLSDNERNQLRSYQSKQKYDTVTDIYGKELYEKHGFTYFAMKRLGYKSSWSQYQQRIPYKYMITGVNGEPLNSSQYDADKTGFNNGNDITVKAGKMNDGQVTSYPFEISDTLDISETHGQWYQLNMEDPEVTVWYSLIDDGGKKDGSSTNYAVSPYDAANNYYIYSKANVFYSGVGHSTVTGDMEARLFINTMIAAYRAAYQPPVVDILNEEAELTDIENTTYQITNAQEYDFDASNGNTVKKEDGGETKVRFSPVELNAVKTKLDCSIYYPSSSGEDGSEKGCKYIDTIYDAKTGQEIKAEKNSDGEYVFKDLQNGHEYYFKYDWAKNGSSEEIDYSQIKFKIKNDKSEEPGYTTLNMLQGQLFALD